MRTAKEHGAQSAEAFSVILSKELADLNIAVNVLLPATILNEPILFLASPLAEGMTGERIIGKEFDR